MKQSIALKHRSSIVVPTVKEAKSGPNPAATALVSNMMTLGFVPTENLFTYLNGLSTDRLATLSEDIIPGLQRLKGADVVYNPMYPNFPQQVMEMSYCELFFNAIIHYWSFGYWKPEYDKLPREFAFENVNFKAIDLISDEEFCEIFDNLLSARESISEGDKKAIEWFLTQSDITYDFHGEIPFKENLCFVASVLLKKGMDIGPFIHTATDLLRVCTALSGGDISLAENTKFKSFPRWQRRLFMGVLDNVIREEDIERHRGKWIRLFHSLHAGEFKGKAAAVANKIRSGGKIYTFNSRVEDALRSDDYLKACDYLQSRPGEFARRLDHLVRMSGRDYEGVLESFFEVLNKVPTRILLGILGNLKVRTIDRDKRIVFPKGSTARATVVRQEIPALDEAIVSDMRSAIKIELLQRFEKLEPLGKCWVAPELLDCPLPTAMRSASEGLIQVARGTRLPIGDDKNTLRFFIYWVGQDIDLSATMHGPDFENLGHISYTRLKSDKFQSYHSGDITRAPNGACEFIDVTMEGALESGVRYIAMNVLVFSGPSFKEHKTVYAGWMTRKHPQSNEIFDPKTVEQKIDLASDSQNAVPVIFDLKERQAIWADMTTATRTWNWGNNVESNRASIGETLEAMLTLDNKFTLDELFILHAKARGELVDSPKDADVKFSFDGDITPYDIAKINSEFII